METEILILNNPNELQHIYDCLSISENSSLFEINDQYDQIRSYIDILFNPKFKQIETQVLQSNIELINSSLAKLFNYSFERNFKKSGIIFVVYTDFFDLDIHRTYNDLHHKLQDLIKKDLIKLVGKNCYSKYVKKTIIQGSVKITTVFDLVKSKNI